jgi:Xaa-Pro dipeptidase
MTTGEPTMPNFKVTEGRGQLLEPIAFTDGEHERRLQALRGAMRERSLDYFISFSPENIYYLTAHDTPGYYFYQACVVSLDEKPVNILRRIESSNTLLKSWSRRTVIYQDTEDPVAATYWYLAELGLIGKSVGIEADSFFVTPRRYNALVEMITKGGGRVEQAQLVEPLRVIKSEEELRYMREAARVTEEGMRAAIASSYVGTTEDQVAAKCLARLAECGGEYAGLPPFITSGPRSSLCHATWAGRTFRFGDVLAYELAGVRQRYAAPLFRCGTVGPAPDDAKHLANACEASLEAVIAKLKPGVTSHDAHMASRKSYIEHGYGELHGHRTGYSIGINYPPDWGEGQIMSLWEGDERTVKANMVFHIVPGVFVPGRYLINITETVLITETGCEPLTSFPRELFEVSKH